MANKVRIAAAYIRVSTDGQLDYSPESQLDEIKKYAKNNNIIIESNYIFVEQDGISGKNADKRAAFQQMMATAKLKPKPFDCILVWKFSRFARNQDEATFYKGTLRKKHGIDVLSVSEPIMEGMYGRLIEMIIEWQDEFYSYNLAGEVHRGMKKKAELGGYNGKAPYGYHKKPKEIPTILDSEARIVRDIFEMFNTGYDKPYICRVLNGRNLKTKNGNKFTPDTIQYILDNPFYIGDIRWNMRKNNHGGINAESEWIYRKGEHEPIIRIEDFELAAERTSKNIAMKQFYAKPISRTKHYLSGLLRCPICHKNLTYMYRKDCRNSAFQCPGYKKGFHNESQYVTDQSVITALMESLNILLKSTNLSFEVISNAPKSSSDEDMILKEIARLESKMQRIKNAYMDGIDTLEEYKDNKNKIETYLHELNSKLSLIEKPMDNKDIEKEFIYSVRSVIDILDSNADNQIKAAALRGIIKYIEHNKDDDNFVFHYYAYK